MQITLTEEEYEALKNKQTRQYEMLTTSHKDLKTEYYYLQKKTEKLQRIVQECFNDICKPSGQISKETAKKLMEVADRSA